MGRICWEPQNDARPIRDGPGAIHQNKRAWVEANGPDHGFLPIVAARLNRNDDEILGDWF